MQNSRKKHLTYPKYLVECTFWSMVSGVHVTAMTHVIEIG